MDDNITTFPTRPDSAPPKPELLIGPFAPEHRVQLDGRVIPLLTGHKGDDGSISLVLDHRFSATFANEAEAWGAAALIANALAIGQGYAWYGSEVRDRPFAARAMRIGSVEGPGAA